MQNHKKIIVTTDEKFYTQDNVIVIKTKDFSTSKHLYQKYNLKPESQNHVKVEFLLQTDRNPRHIIKELDILLKVNAHFEIVLYDSPSHSQYLRSRMQIKYEFSVSTNGRYKFISSKNENGVLKLKYEKKEKTLPENDYVGHWSFGIVSNGQKNDWVNELINSIKSQGIKEYEIIICGPSPFNESEINVDDKIKVIDEIHVDDIRAPIGHKKNQIIQSAKYNNLCIMHDRFLLPDDWYKNMKSYGNYFDVLCLKTLSLNGERFGVDWMKFQYPLTSRFKLNKPLSYHQWHHDAIIQGGVMVLKKNLVQSFMFDERLFWDELEDMQFSKFAYLNGILVLPDRNNYFISRAVRHKGMKKGNKLHKYFTYYYWLRGIISNYLKYKKAIFNYSRIKL